jgi:hypothetical protein
VGQTNNSGAHPIIEQANHSTHCNAYHQWGKPRVGNGWWTDIATQLLDNGQGKSASDMDISNSSSDEDYPPAPTTTTTMTREQAAHKLLRPPIIQSAGVIATGATTTILCKQNKAHRNKKLLQQPVTTQWITHDSAMILPPKHWEQWGKTLADREMAPRGLTLQHKKSQLLTEWENFGCPTRTGRNWTLSKIQRQSTAAPTSLHLNQRLLLI